MRSFPSTRSPTAPSLDLLSRGTFGFLGAREVLGRGAGPNWDHHDMWIDPLNPDRHLVSGVTVGKAMPNGELEELDRMTQSPGMRLVS